MTRVIERADYGHDARHKKGVVRPELTGRGHAVRMRVKDGCELDRLHMKGLISPHQHSAGCQLARDLHGARLLGLATVNFGGGGGGGGDITDAQSNALLRVSDALEALDRMVGVGPRVLTTNVCLDVGQATDVRVLSALRLGLDALLSHYDKGVSTVFTVSVADLSV